MDLNKNNIKGLAGTILFHLILLVCFLFLGLRTPLPLPEEEGVEVNLGYSDQGMGDAQPEEPAENASPIDQTEPVNEQITTQNTEESVNLNQNKPQPNTNPEQEEIEEQPKINPNALYQKNNAQKDNEGLTGNPGDQGNPGGDPDAANYYGMPGSGGIAYSLTGRSVKSLPKPNYASSSEGTVVVEIWVNKYGQVTRVRAGSRGTTTSDQVLWKLAEDAAKKASFDISNDAPEEQKGSITYHFRKLN